MAQAISKLCYTMIQLIKELRTNTLTMVFNLLTLMNTTTGSWLVI